MSNHLKALRVPHWCNHCAATSQPQNIAVLVLSTIGSTVRKVTISSVERPIVLKCPDNTELI
jgi:hypothetical protein